jgi:hypothetical protein
MKALSLNSFSKTSACPSSSMLLSHCSSRLSSEISTLVKNHLAVCDFCDAEVNLLSHCNSSLNTPHRKAPELPINLRILAESILSQSKRVDKNPTARHGLMLSD